jgi:hypothetical protein
VLISRDSMAQRAVRKGLFLRQMTHLECSSSNQVVGGSNPSGRAKIFCTPNTENCKRSFNGGNSNRRLTTRRFDKPALRRLGRRRAAAAVRSEAEDEGPQAPKNPSGRAFQSRS